MTPMRVRRFWMALRTLTPGERHLLAEAAMLTAVVWLGLRTLSFASLRQVLEACCRRTAGHPSDPLSGIAWAVQAASRRIPGGRTCLVEALVADVMLRRRGYQPVLHLGVRKQHDRTPPLTGHAWVVCNNRVVVGTVADLAGYTAMSSTRSPGR